MEVNLKPRRGGVEAGLLGDRDGAVSRSRSRTEAGSPRIVSNLSKISTIMLIMLLSLIGSRCHAPFPTAEAQELDGRS